MQVTSTTASNNNFLLKVKGLRTHFYTKDGVVKAVDGVDLKVMPGEIFGLVGESGCGKSVTALSILRLIEAPGKITAGTVHFDGNSLMDLSKREMVDLRGMQISMIFQQPRSSLNPVFSIGAQVAEVFQIHQGMKKEQAWKRAVDLLRQVGIPDPEERAQAYPHQMSGGQAQRVMIAMALALNPKLLIADEPTSALDVTIQAQILDLIQGLSKQRNTAVILITHDLGIIAEMTDRVAVMYAGHVVEQANLENLFENPMHPYTRGLMNSIPIMGQEKDLLETIPGTVPNLIDMPPGCRFAPRCTAMIENDLTICNDKQPDLIGVENGHSVRCWLYQSDDDHIAPRSIYFLNEAIDV